jgi:menaquinone-specific isochorismate synthase
MPDTRHPHTPENVAALFGAIQPQFGQVHIRNRGRLPHWEMDSGLYFITFRLADALPRAVLTKVAERHRILETARISGIQLSPEQEAELAEYSSSRIEAYCDHGSGSCALKDPRIAGAMAAALRFRDRKHYRLIAWCIMPNHVHVVVRLLPGALLAAILKSWKQFSSKAANEVIGQRGRFWQREYYDHLIRNEQEFSRAIQYVLENPAKAALKNWPSVWSELSAHGVDAEVCASAT